MEDLALVGIQQK